MNKKKSTKSSVSGLNKDLPTTDIINNEHYIIYKTLCQQFDMKWKKYNLIKLLWKEIEKFKFK